MTQKTENDREIAWLRSITGDLATSVLRRMELTLPWFADMPPGRRSAVGMVAQSGISAIVSWFEDGGGAPWVARDVFDSAPRELLRSVSLQQTLQLIQVVVEVVEERVANASSEIREGVLRYSRDVAFAAAELYARAAEQRGLWDARLEALVVDSILTGEHDTQLLSRVAALGWSNHGEVAVLVGTAPRIVEVDQLRRTARQNHADLLVSAQGNRLVLVIGRTKPSAEFESAPATFQEIAKLLEGGFGQGYLVLGPEVPNIVTAAHSAHAALAAFSVAGAYRTEHRPVLSDELLPERALSGDPLARKTLVQRAYLPLATQHADLLATLWCYLDNGRSLEATARELFVHPNTVRYRLKRVSEVVGWDATGAREALILQSALILGRIADTNSSDGRASARHTRRSG